MKTERILYYTPPSDTAFEDMREACMAVWETKSDEYGYRSEKIGRIENLANIGDNFMYMFAMFDQFNQLEVVKRLSEETKKAVRERMISGGNQPSYLISIGL